MIVGEEFAWAHLPKAGGSATLELFRVFPRLIQFGDLDDSNAKHTPFSEREDLVGGKTLALNLRRLPFWVVSRAQHASRWGVWPNYEPIPMATPEELSQRDFPDTRIAIFTDNGRFKIDRWLRMENLADDFLDFVSEFTDPTGKQRERVRNLPPVNAHDYDHEIESWFTSEQIERLYERNPVWASLEREVYGDLFRLE
jgi:hypothetical protein